MFIPLQPCHANNPHSAKAKALEVARAAAREIAEAVAQSKALMTTTIGMRGWGLQMYTLEIDYGKPIGSNWARGQFPRLNDNQ